MGGVGGIIFVAHVPDAGGEPVVVVVEDEQFVRLGAGVDDARKFLEILLGRNAGVQGGWQRRRRRWRWQSRR